jgi:hypothetical protein
MVRTSFRVLMGAVLLVVSLATALEARAAGDVVVTVSPSVVGVGEPVEVLLRTFLPIERAGTLPQSSAREPYPAPSGYWNVLFPWDDYPFDVVAWRENDRDIAIALARDPSDATLWRGMVSLPAAGTWTIWVRNFPGRQVGSTTTVTVHPGQLAGTPSSAATAATSGTRAAPTIGPGPAALVGILFGLGVGALLAELRRRRAAPH